MATQAVPAPKGQSIFFLTVRRRLRPRQVRVSLSSRIRLIFVASQIISYMVAPFNQLFCPVVYTASTRSTLDLCVLIFVPLENLVGENVFGKVLLKVPQHFLHRDKLPSDEE